MQQNRKRICKNRCWKILGAKIVKDVVCYSKDLYVTVCRFCSVSKGQSEENFKYQRDKIGFVFRKQIPEVVWKMNYVQKRSVVGRLS